MPIAAISDPVHAIRDICINCIATLTTCSICNVRGSNMSLLNISAPHVTHEKKYVSQ